MDKQGNSHKSIIDADDEDLAGVLELVAVQIARDVLGGATWAESGGDADDDAVGWWGEFLFEGDLGAGGGLH